MGGETVCIVRYVVFAMAFQETTESGALPGRASSSACLPGSDMFSVGVGGLKRTYQCESIVKRRRADRGRRALNGPRLAVLGRANAVVRLLLRHERER